MARWASEPTSVQRRFDQGGLSLPDRRPAAVSERAWIVLVRHVRDRMPYTALAGELGVSQHTAGQLAAQAAEALRYPDLPDLPGVIRQALVRGGYTTREAVARASDADVLCLKRMSPARLRAVRAVIPRAESPPPWCPAWRLYGPLRGAGRPGLGGDLRRR